MVCVAPKRKIFEMKKTLFALSTAIALCGCDSVSASICSSPTTKTLLQDLLQKNVLDVINQASPDDPYTFDMKDSDIVTVYEDQHKTTCKFLAKMSNRANPISDEESVGEDEWIHYTVEKTDENDKTYVTIFLPPSLQQSVNLIKTMTVAKELARKAAAQEEAENTIDTSASCDDRRAMEWIKSTDRYESKVTNVVTTSPGVCVAYLVSHHGVGPYFRKLPYTITLGSIKGSTVSVPRDGWQDSPYPEQTVAPEDMVSATPAPSRLNQIEIAPGYTAKDYVTGKVPGVSVGKPAGGGDRQGGSGAQRAVGPDQYFYSANGREYEYVAAPGITWQEAFFRAASKSLNGVSGYLASVTSQAELDFIENTVIPGGARTANVYLGGQQVALGKWVWVAGPEAGLVFWNKGPVGTFAPWDPIYSLSSGASASPNSGRSSYLYLNSWHRAYFTSSWGASQSSVSAGGNSGYVVEYSGLPGKAGP